jgi:2-hydroxychromene-2-carboxylate isomerase
MAERLRFFFDFISPYAYLGWAQIHRVADKHGIEVEPVPILFAALLDAWGHKGPAEIPPKRIYTWKHVVRLAHDVGVPIRPPPSHPFNPLLALRVASMPMAEPQRRRVIDVLYARTWARGEGVTDPEGVAAALSGIGLGGAALVVRAAEAEAKARVKEQTAEALQLGVFGVPTMEIRDELFWGQDSLPHLDRFLAGDDPLSDEELDRWQDVPASATRSSN